MVERSRGKERNGVFILTEFECSREPQTSKGVFLTRKLLGWLCAVGLTRPPEREPTLVLRGLLVGSAAGGVDGTCGCGWHLFGGTREGFSGETFTRGNAALYSCSTALLNEMGTGLGAGGCAQPATLPGCIQAKVEGTEDS